MKEYNSSRDWGLGCLGIITVAVLFIIFSQNSSTPNRTSAPPVPLGMYRTKITAPCAVDRTASNNMIQAIQDRDQEAIDGLAERKQLYILTEGTRFEASSDEPPFLWGFVRSGRYSGETCYVLAGVMVR